ncbi:universal stress protein [Rhodococcoides trifolii]|uniref:Universal stress protein n=1 Tax=Rhodococcoides trifolii TaxID=908250 RepID=A0A917CTR0_9NOCA|nr:universal stress protein [Rhodococcus trifolii]GGF98077.1 universal stress protein [Rhodococcus trifolii]
MTIVLSYIPTPEGLGALPFGFTEARLRETDVVVIPDGDAADRADFDANVQSAREEANALDVKYRVSIGDGDRTHADNLIDASYDAGASLLVIGMRRRSPVGKLLMGSVVQRVLLDAHCPVAAIKPPVGAPH